MGKEADHVQMQIWGEQISATIFGAPNRPARSLNSRQEILRNFFDNLAVFESSDMAAAVLDHGGEVLRFIGDAALAIFPIAIS
jgi:hypothetical protein